MRARVLVRRSGKFVPAEADSDEDEGEDTAAAAPLYPPPPAAALPAVAPLAQSNTNSSIAPLDAPLPAPPVPAAPVPTAPALAGT